MKNFLQTYFSFSSTERNGIIVLISVIVLLIIIWSILPNLSFNKNNQEIAAFESEITAFENSLVIYDSIQNNLKDSIPVNYFKFNPNTLSDSGWHALGLKAYQIKTIKHFLEKGGQFRRASDFQKMYCIKQSQFDELEPFILIPEQTKSNVSVEGAEKKKITLHEFDPNCTTSEEWEQLGLSAKQVSVIGNFLSKGGKFKNKDDFKKIYCIQPKLFDQLEPYISITAEPVKLPKYDVDIKIDINTADSGDFRKIKGISPYLARSIVKYRNALGGFVQIKQLLEVWGCKYDTYIIIEKNLFLSGKPINKMNLNTVAFADMLKHPYLNYNFTKSIVQFRKVMGKIKTFQELVTNKIIPDSTIIKIQPYFLLE